MGFVERIFGKIDHGIVDRVRCLLADAIGDTALNPLFFISINKVLPLRIDDILLLFTHGPSDVIRLSHRIACQLLHNLHNLLLVDDTAVGRL